MEQTSKDVVLKIPLSVFESAETKEDLEDWLLSHDFAFIDEMRRLKAEAEEGRGRPLADLAKKWNIKL
ncbi:MAG: hypothetical protein HYU99_09685 [Deltaproteobacteria bacterium]|nr:hypothetical protein [Deltaproteobacteria bacterium]